MFQFDYVWTVAWGIIAICAAISNAPFAVTGTAIIMFTIYLKSAEIKDKIDEKR